MEDYKQKYEQALENIKKIKAANKDNNELVDFIEYEYPELKGCNDERIRKELKSFFDSEMSDYGNVEWRKGIRYGEIVAWLEKQGEQKTEIKYIYPKFRVGDVIEPAKPNGYSIPVRVKYIGEGYYSCESDDCKSFLSFPVCDENKYVLTEQKSYWSEEDEKFLNLSLVNLTELKNRFGEKYGKVGDCILWLKSLKDRYTWKPSDEQMQALSAAGNSFRPFEEGHKVLWSLYNDLKKLREE